MTDERNDLVSPRLSITEEVGKWRQPQHQMKGGGGGGVKEGGKKGGNRKGKKSRKKTTPRRVAMRLNDVCVET